MSASLGRALMARGVDRRALLRFGMDEARTQLAIRRERLRKEFRPRRREPSEHPGWAWPPQRRGVSRGRK